MTAEHAPSKITDRIFQLGRKQSCIYLLQGRDTTSGESDYALLGGGMVTIGPEVVEQIHELGVDPKNIGRIVVQHAHFDHCGAVTYLQRQWPWMEVWASRTAAELLQKTKVVEAIQSMNAVLLQRMGMEEKAEEPGFRFSGLQVNRALADGDRVPCGDLELQVLEAPGHSPCSIALYEPWQQALFTSDSAGIPMGSEVFTAANSDFDQYEQSLSRLVQCEVQAVLPEHFGARTGTQAREFLGASLSSARQTRQLLQESLRSNPDVDSCSQQVAEHLMERMPDDFLPREVVSIVVGQMVKNIARQQSAEQ